MHALTRLASVVINMKNARLIKRDLKAAVWHPLRWWDWWIPKDEKKKCEQSWGGEQCKNLSQGQKHWLIIEKN